MKGFPFCAEAAREGRLDVLQWLRGHNCPWDEETGKGAAESGNWTLLRWVLDQEPEWAAVREVEVSEPEEEEEIIDDIEAEDEEDEEDEEEGTKVWCIWIILKGERKGDLCGRPSHGSDFCKFHKTVSDVCADRLAALREREERDDHPEEAELATRRHVPKRALPTCRAGCPADFQDGDSAHDPTITKEQLDRELNQMRREREEFLRKEKFGRKKKCLKFPPRPHTVGCVVAGTDESDFCRCCPKGGGEEEEAAGDERWAHEPGCDWEEGYCSCVVGWEEAHETEIDRAYSDEKE